MGQNYAKPAWSLFKGVPIHLSTRLFYSAVDVRGDGSGCLR
jgi:hypothetical protein